MRLLYFAWVRERIGRGEETMPRPEGATTVSALMDILSAASPGHAAAFADRDRVKVAVNQVFVAHEHEVHDADEIAFFPPVTGG